MKPTCTGMVLTEQEKNWGETRFEPTIFNLGCQRDAILHSKLRHIRRLGHPCKKSIRKRQTRIFYIKVKTLRSSLHGPSLMPSTTFPAQKPCCNLYRRHVRPFKCHILTTASFTDSLLTHNAKHALRPVFEAIPPLKFHEII